MTCLERLFFFASLPAIFALGAIYIWAGRRMVPDCAREQMERAR